MIDFSSGRFYSPARMASTNSPATSEGISLVPRVLERYPLSWGLPDTSWHSPQGERWLAQGTFGDVVLSTSTPGRLDSGASFHFNLNEPRRERFTYSDQEQRWLPLKGGPALSLGVISPDFSADTLEPPSFLPVGSLYVPRVFLLGADPGESALSDLRIRVVSGDGQGYDFTGDPVDGVVGRESGMLYLSPAATVAREGETLWYSALRQASTQALASMAEVAEGQQVYLSPVPESFETPLLRFGSRSYLTVSVVASEALVNAAPEPDPGTVRVAATSGLARFNSTDVLRAVLTDPTFDRAFAGEFVYYDGVVVGEGGALQIAGLVNNLDQVVAVELGLPLFVPPGSLYSNPPTTGIFEAYDGTGVVPEDSGTEGDTRATGTGRVRTLGAGGPLWLLSNGVRLEVVQVDRDSDLPTNVARISGGTAYIARETGRVVFSLADLRNIAGNPAYLCEGLVVPSVQLSGASIFSFFRYFVRLTGEESVSVWVDGVEQTWNASTIFVEGRSLYSTAEIATSLTLASIPASTVKGRLWVSGDVSVCVESSDTPNPLGFPSGVFVGVSGGQVALNGVCLSLERSAADFGAETLDVRTLGRVVDYTVQASVTQVPYIFLPVRPLLDIPGYDDDVFFQITSEAVADDGTVELVQEPLVNWENAQYLFEVKRFAFLQLYQQTRNIDQPAFGLALGVPTIAPLTFEEEMGGLLVVDREGVGALERVTFGEDAIFDAATSTITFLSTVSQSVFTGNNGRWSGGQFSTVSDVIPANTRLVVDGTSAYRLGAGGVFEGSPAPEDAYPVPYEIYEDAVGGTLVDGMFTPFSHLPSEPFVVQLITPLVAINGVIPSAPLASAVQRGREIALRAGALQVTQAILPLVPLPRRTLGVISNDSLYVPTGNPTRFSELAYTLLLGERSLTPTLVPDFTSSVPEGQAAVLSSPWSDPVSGNLLPIGTIRFSDADLESSAGMVVTFNALPLPYLLRSVVEVEFSPFTFAIYTPPTVGDLPLQLEEELIVGSDVAISPLDGSVSLLVNPLNAGQSLEATYYLADPAGARVPGDPITEFLPIFMSRESAVRVTDKIYRYNTALRSVATHIPPTVFAGVIQMNFTGNTDYTLEYLEDGSVDIRFNTSLADTVQVSVTYAVLDASGGERAFDLSSRPVYRPPFLIPAGTRVVGLRGHRTDLQAGQVWNVGGTLLYIKKVNLFTSETQGNTTGVVIFPPTTEEVGSRSPGNDALAWVSDGPLVETVDPTDPVAILGSVPDLWLTLTGGIEPVMRGATSILYRGTQASLEAGCLLEIAGYPHLVSGISVSDTGDVTQIDLAKPILRGFEADVPLKVTARPIPFTGLSSISVGAPFYAPNPVTLVRYPSRSGVGQVLVEGSDFARDLSTGAIALREGLVAGEVVEMSRSTINTISPTVRGGVTLTPRLQARFRAVTTPSQENGLLGAKITATFSFPNPDTFLLASQSMASLLSQTAQDFEEDFKGTTPTYGASLVGNSTDPGVLGPFGKVRKLAGRDLAARRFLEYYNGLTTAWENIEETITGGVVGDRDGRVRFEVGSPAIFPNPGGEDAVSGELNPRLLWAEVFGSQNPDYFVSTSDPITVPTNTTVVDGRLVGSAPAADTFTSYIEAQKALVRNDIDDVILLRRGRTERHRYTSAPYYLLATYGVFAVMSDRHGLSRLFPARTRLFTTTAPGVGAGDGVYTFGRLLSTRRSTYGKTVATLTNPVLGDVTGITRSEVFKRRARAEIFAWGATGFDALATTTPSIMALPTSTQTAVVDPGTGLLNPAFLLSQGGDTFDLLSGDLDLSTPAFGAGDRLALGKPDGTVYELLYAGENLDIFGTPAYGGVFVGAVVGGCVLTLADAQGNVISSASDVLVGSDPASGTPLGDVIARGDTVMVVSPSALSSAPSDPATSEDITRAARAMDGYREGFDLAVRSDGSIIDLSLPSKRDPFFLPLQEMLGQNPLDPVSSIEARVDFGYSDANPLRVPALDGLYRDDAGDRTVPYISTPNSELNRFDQIQSTLAAIIGSVDINGDAQYPDEFRISGEVLDAITTSGSLGSFSPATLRSPIDLLPVAHGGTAAGVKDVRPFDFLIAETSGSNPVTLQGFLSVGRVDEVEVETGVWESALLVPRFVTATTPRTSASLIVSTVRYRLGNAQVFIDSTYPVDPQVLPTPPGLRVISRPADGVTILDFSDLSPLALNDGLAAGAGNLNNLWSINPADQRYYNQITFELIARTDANITEGPSGPAPLPVAGEVVCRITIQGDTVTTEDYLGNVNTTAITGVTFGTTYPSPSVVISDNKQVIIESATPWFDFAGATASNWYLPYTNTAGVSSSIYGYEYALSVNTYNVPGVGKGGSRSSWIAEDRLTFNESLDMRWLKRRGYTHPLSSLSLEGRLVVEEVDLGSNNPNRVNAFVNGELLGEPVPFTFPQQAGATGDNAGATWVGGTFDVGSISVPSWEGFANASFDTPLVINALPTTSYDTTGLIASGVGQCESKDHPGSSVHFPNYDSRITNTLVDLSRVHAGDVCVITSSADLDYAATSKAGTYLIRNVVQQTDGTGAYKEITRTSIAGGGAATSFPFTFPLSTGYTIGSGLEVTDLLSFDGAPLLPSLTPSGFPSSGRVFITLNVADLASTEIGVQSLSVISCDYASINEVDLRFEGCSNWQDATGAPMSENSFATFVNAGTTYQVSGFTHIPVGFVDDGHRVVGYDPHTPSPFSIYGFRYLTFSPPVTGIVGAGNVVFNGDSSGLISATVGWVRRGAGSTPGTLRLYDATPVNNTIFTSDPDAVVFENVPDVLDLTYITNAQWTTMYGLSIPTLLPGTGLSFVGPLGEPGFLAQAGIFFEPSVPKTSILLTAGIPRIVDASHSVPSDYVGFVNPADTPGLDASGAAITVPDALESVVFEVRRARRWQAIQDEASLNLAALRFAYEIRRSRLTDVTASMGGLVLEAVSFTQEFALDNPAAPKSEDIWNTGETHTGTNLGTFLDPDVNIHPGDRVVFLDDSGDAEGFARIVAITGAGSLFVRDTGGFTPTVGQRFEIHLNNAPVPHEQSYNTLRDHAFTRRLHRTIPDMTSGLGGYVPNTGTPATDANTLYDDLNITGSNTFTRLGVREGDILVVDPLGSTGVADQRGAGPQGDRGVPFRSEHVAGRVSNLDDNRGHYEIVSVESDHITVTGAHTLAGDLLSGDVIFPEGGDTATYGFAVYPTVNDSPIFAGGVEGQNELRPTEGAPFEANNYSVRPFGYSIYRPNPLVPARQRDLILSGRERMLSWIEEVRDALLRSRSGSYFIFQLDEHASDLGTEGDTSDGLGVSTNPYIAGIVGELDVVPFLNTTDCLSLLDRRFWVADRRLEYLTAAPGFGLQQAGLGDTPYLVPDEVFPLLQDRIEEVVGGVGGPRDLRYTWIVYRTHASRGTVKVKGFLTTSASQESQEARRKARLLKNIEDTNEQ